MSKSRIKQWVKQIIPSKFIEVYHAVRKRPSYYWDGIYQHFRDVPAYGRYDNDEWVHSIFENTKNILDLSNVGGRPCAGDR